jgi:hypothetical protein
MACGTQAQSKKLPTLARRSSAEGRDDYLAKLIASHFNVKVPLDG